MVVFNECRITDDGKYLIIEASVDSLNYYKNVYITDIIIDTDETWSPSGPSSNNIYNNKFKLEDTTISSVCGSVHTEESNCECGNLIIDEKKGRKNIRLYLTAKDLNLSSLNNNIFFIYVRSSGLDRETPCGLDHHTVMTVALNLRPIYNSAMGYIRSLGDTCEVPKGFIDMFLKYKALELALKTGNYTEAIKMWRYLIKEGTMSSVTKKGCRCHGIK